MKIKVDMVPIKYSCRNCGGKVFKTPAGHHGRCKSRGQNRSWQILNSVRRRASFVSPGESFAISAQKEKMAKESGRMASVRILPLSAIVPSPNAVGSAKFQRLVNKRSGKK